MFYDFLNLIHTWFSLGHPRVRPFVSPKKYSAMTRPSLLLSRLHSVAPRSLSGAPALLHTAPSLTHLDEHGRASMVDIADKRCTKRTATAIGRIYIPLVAYELVTATYPSKDEITQPTSDEEKAKAKARRKGDALTVAQLAAIMGAKKTSDLIPLCHSLSLTTVSVTMLPEVPDDQCGSHRHSIVCRATVSTDGKTGVEMEALTAVTIGLLTVWDMLKAVAGKEMEIGEIMVSQKSGGRSGDFERVRNREPTQHG